MKPADSIALINGREWTKIGHWKTTTIIDDIAGRACLEARYFEPFGLIDCRLTLLGVHDDWFFLKSEFDSLHDFYLSQIRRDINYLSRTAEALDQISYEVEKEVNQAIALNELFEALKRVESLGVAIVPLDLAIESYIKEEGYDEAILEHVFPIRRALMIEERVDFLKMKLEAHSGTDAASHARKHSETYGWMKNVNWRTEGHSPDYYISLLDEINADQARKELAGLEDTDSFNKKAASFLSSHDERHAAILPMLRQLLDAKMLNWDVVGMAQNKWRQLIKADPVLSAMEYKPLTFLVADELIALSKGDLSRKEAEARAESRYQGKISLATEDLIVGFNENNARSLDLYKQNTNVAEVKGNIGFRGKARGKVRIIMGSAHAHSMKEGEVLVCPMTNPDLMPAILKAVALVTDEGGLLCHAAIVSRELKKPCVIGTKIATKAFKDGDMVEVDAEKGIVTKIG